MNRWMVTYHHFVLFQNWEIFKYCDWHQIIYCLFFKSIKQWSLDGQTSLKGKFQNRSINEVLEQIQTAKFEAFVDGLGSFPFCLSIFPLHYYSFEGFWSVQKIIRPTKCTSLHLYFQNFGNGKNGGGKKCRGSWHRIV